MRIPFLIVMSSMASVALTLRCYHCGGQKVTFDQWMLSEGETCRLKRAKCLPNAHSCIVAQIRGSQNFSISGCSHDHFLGCDSHHIPFDALVKRCQCVGDYCNLQWYKVPKSSLAQYENALAMTNGIVRLSTSSVFLLILLLLLT
ncbi:hypothetical protein QR680_015307 [Steinernema hermaphroditum]|uniref:Protein quiver n=1 Tax=Steinernema hermaphroditum TaxID=289476 RepID=A0AA39H954_9BILA|nr:hypothetical protein QR680_015307 [Steinernema hermaphroditum]